MCVLCGGSAKEFFSILAAICVGSAMGLVPACGGKKHEKNPRFPKFQVNFSAHLGSHLSLCVLDSLFFFF